MKLRIRNIPSGQRSVMERLAYVLLGIVVLLCVGGMVTRMVKRRQPTSATAMAIPAPPPQPASQPPAVEVAKKAEVVQKAEIPPPPPPAVAEEPVKDTPPPKPPKEHPVRKPPEAGEPEKNGFELTVRGPVAVLAYEESAAAEMRKEPGHMSDLVQKGLLFSAPNHTEVAIEERHDGLVKVRILDTAMEGKVGWVRSNQVVAK